MLLLTTLTSCLGLPSFANNQKQNSKITAEKYPEPWKVDATLNFNNLQTE